MHVIKFRGVRHLRLGVEGGVLGGFYVAQTAAQDPRNEVNAAGLSANGFTLPVNVPVTLPTRSVIYCTATSATATRVSVMAFSFAEG